VLCRVDREVVAVLLLRWPGGICVCGYGRGSGFFAFQERGAEPGAHHDSAVCAELACGTLARHTAQANCMRRRS
jgi:hypothetical protein